jgi:hypothetical protein
MKSYIEFQRAQHNSQLLCQKHIFSELEIHIHASAQISNNSSKRAQWQYLPTHSRRPVILVLWWCRLINIQFLIIFCSFLYKISELMGRTMKSKADVEIWFVNQRIANRLRNMEPINVD